MAFKALIVILSLILQACSFNFQDGKRVPAAAYKNLELEVLQMKNFRNRLIGTEKESKCSKESLDRDFNKLISSVRKDSCSIDNFTIDREEFDEKSCPKIKIEGYFDRVVKQTIKEEKEELKLTYFENKLDAEFINFVREAQTYRKKISDYLFDNNFTHQEKVELVAAYAEYVLLPVRDVVIIKRSYLESEKDGIEYFNNLQLLLPDDFVNDLEFSEKGLITQGPNPSVSPLYLQIHEIADNTFMLGFAVNDIVRRDVLTLLKAPTAKNYVMALKWMTLHMMLSQAFVYDTILGNKKAIPIPNSCQKHFNGSLPPQFQFQYEDGAGDNFLDNILAGHGLTYKEDDLSYLDYYVDNINKDPTKDGYSALVPFENYKIAKVGMSGNGGRGIAAQIDDISHYKAVLSLKMSEALGKFKGKIKKQSVTYQGYETFQKMLGEFPLDEIAQITMPNGTIEEIYPGKQNLSPYLLELMRDNGFTDYTQLMTKKFKDKLKNKRVLIDFPSMNSSPIWRDWGLKTLADLLDEYKDLPRSSSLHQLIKLACQTRESATLKEAYNICKSENVVVSLANFLSEFKTSETYIPTRRLEEKKFQMVYPLLNDVWNNLRNNSELLKVAKPYELDFLMDQMSAGNPWARLRFSYLIAIDQLEHEKEGLPPTYQFTGFKFKINNNARCSARNVNTELSKIQSAGMVLGLHLPLTYAHAQKILTKKEKVNLWQNIVSEIEQRNAQLFSVKSAGKSYYQIAEKISQKTILTPQAAQIPELRLSTQASSEIKRISQGTEAELGTFFLKLYQLKNHEKQKELFDRFSLTNGIDNTFSLKLNFLALDEAYKKPMYKDLLRAAAHTRKLQVLSQLDSFCKMSVEDEKQMKSIFYSASKAQNEMNQLAGLPGVPSEVLEKINEMTSDEWRDMWWGIGSGLAGVAAIIIGGACTTVSGGICAPLGGAMAVTGLASLGIQVKLTANEVERKHESDRAEEQVQIMEDLGFANLGSAESVHRSYAWAAFEAITIFPLIGVATRSLTLGPKLVYVSTQSMLNKSGKTSFKAAAKSAVQEEEVRGARYLLGLDSVSKNVGLDSKNIDKATSQIEKIRKLYTSGDIDLETMIIKIGKIIDPIKKAKLVAQKVMRKEVGKVTVKESAQVIDQQTARMITDYFGDNPKELLRLIQGYSGEKLEKAVRVMKEVDGVGRIGNRIPVYSGAKDWFLRLRNESLARNASKIIRIEKELMRLGNKPGELQAFISKNLDDLTDIFIDIPMKKREVPYFVFVQGMPDFNFFKGRKIPLLSSMSEGQTLKRIVTARARLVHESFKSQARLSLKLKKFVQAETAYGAFKGFQYSLAEAISKKTSKDGSALLSKYQRLEDVIARKLYVEYSKNGPKLEYSKFKSMIFYSYKKEDQALVEALWESIPPQHLLGTKESSDLAHIVARDLSKYDSVDGFERYLNALKLLLINKNPAVLEII